MFEICVYGQKSMAEYTLNRFLVVFNVIVIEYLFNPEFPLNPTCRVLVIAFLNSTFYGQGI